MGVGVEDISGVGVSVGVERGRRGYANGVGVSVGVGVAVDVANGVGVSVGVGVAVDVVDGVGIGADDCVSETAAETGSDQGPGSPAALRARI